MLLSTLCITTAFVTMATTAKIEGLKVTTINKGHVMKFDWHYERLNEQLHARGKVILTEDITDITAFSIERRCDLDLTNCEPYKNELVPECGVPPNKNTPWGLLIGSIHYDGQCPFPAGIYDMYDLYITPQNLIDMDHGWNNTLDILARDETGYYGIVGQLNVLFGPPGLYQEVQDDN